MQPAVTHARLTFEYERRRARSLSLSLSDPTRSLYLVVHTTSYLLETRASGAAVAGTSREAAQRAASPQCAQLALWTTSMRRRPPAHAPDFRPSGTAPKQPPPLPLPRPNPSKVESEACQLIRWWRFHCLPLPTTVSKLICLQRSFYGQRFSNKSLLGIFGILQSALQLAWSSDTRARGQHNWVTKLHTHTLPLLCLSNSASRGASENVSTFLRMYLRSPAAPPVPHPTRIRPQRNSLNCQVLSRGQVARLRVPGADGQRENQYRIAPAGG